MEYIIVLISLIILYLLINVMGKLDRLEARFKGVKAAVDQAAAQLGVPEHPVNDELRSLLKEGKDVQAVKTAREILGLSLLEAKQYVDRL